jgi:hemoglobin/transferrin/lactoferrin receptor protein
MISGKANSRFSSANNERTAHFDGNVGWKNWAMLTSISANKFDDLRQGSNGPDDYIKPYFVTRIDSIDRVITQEDPLLQIPSAYSQTNFMQKVRFKPNENWDFRYGFHYSETSSYGRYDRHNQINNNLPRYAEWNYGPQKWMMNHLNITHQKENSFYDKMSLRLAQQSFEESRISRNFNKDNRNIRVENVEAYSINLDFVKNIRSRHTLFYGGETILNQVSSGGVIENIVTGEETKGTSRYPSSDWSSVAVFVNDEFSLTEKIKLQVGFRYNQFILNAEFDTSFYDFPFQKTNLNNGSLTSISP